MSTVERAPRLGLGSRILIGMVVGSVGAPSPVNASLFSTIGDLFIRVLVLAAVPLVFFNLLAGLTTLTDFACSVASPPNSSPTSLLLR